MDQFAMKLYADAGADLCCHPDYLALQLGLEVVPPFRELDWGTYRDLARRILQRDRPSLVSDAAVALLADALILPRLVAHRVATEYKVSDLPKVQPYAREDVVLRIYASYLGSKHGPCMVVAS
jgi:hypothetical protein